MWCNLCLGCTGVLAPVLGVDALEVEGTGPDVVDGSLGGVARRVVVLLTELEGRSKYAFR